MTATTAAIPGGEIADADYGGVDIRVLHDDEPQWRAPVRVYLRQMDGKWGVIGVERPTTGGAPRLAADE
jgi:hypothetical protein